MQFQRNTFGILALLYCCSAGAFAQDSPPVQPPDEDAAALIQKTVKQAAQHRKLEQLEGSWKVERTDAQVGGSGTMTFRPIAMDKFVAEELEFGGGNLWIQVNAVYGYDPLRDVYTATWYTSFNTVAFVGTAKPDPDLDGFNFQLEHPILSLKPEEALFYRITIVDESRMKLELLAKSELGEEEVRAAFLAVRDEATSTSGEGRTDSRGLPEKGAPDQ